MLLSLSSRATMAAVKPTPTNTTSTGGSVLATALPSLTDRGESTARHGMMVLVRLCDRHWLALEPLSMVGVDAEISGVSARKADHAPSHHVTVATVHGIREEALDRIGKQGF